MGSPFCHVLAHIFVGYFEIKLFNDVEKPFNWFRNVDDIFVSYKSDYHLNGLFNKISSIHPSLKFTIKNNVDGCQPVLYILLQRSSTFVSRYIYRRPTYVGPYIPLQSLWPILHKVNLISCLVLRAHKTCSISRFRKEIENIRNIIVSIGLLVWYYKQEYQ